MNIRMEHLRHQTGTAPRSVMSPDLLQDHSTSVAYVTAVSHSPQCSSHTTPVYSEHQQQQQQQQKRRKASRGTICCTFLTSSIVSNLLIWSVGVALILSYSLMAVKEDEKHLQICLLQVVCNESVDAGSSSTHHSSAQQQQQQQQQSHSLLLYAVNNKTFNITQTGIYLVHSQLAFKTPTDRHKSGYIFEHEIRSKVGDTRSKPLVRDAQEKNPTPCVADESCHTTLIVSTLYLRRDSLIYVSADPVELLYNPTNTAVFNVTRLN